MVALTGDKTVQPAPVGKSSNIRIAEVGRAILNVLTLFEDFEPAAVPLPADSRIFEIDGKLPGESDVKAGNAKLHVVVLKGRLVKIAIRPVQVRDDNGQVVAHAEGKFDIPALVATMNQIWTVQSNVVFELVSADPILVADEVAIARAMDLKAERAKLPREVNMVDFAAMFDGFRDKKADFTFFLVHRVLDRKKGESGHGLTVTGASSRLFPVSLIGDDMNVSTIAHEAGHLLGFKGHSDTGPRMLMNEGGPGVGLGKIPLSWAKSFNAGIK
jgi:hypothetical protein